MKVIYVLELKDNNYYIGKTNNFDIRFQVHKDGHGSKFTKIFKPINVLHIYSTDNEDFDEKIITLYYMGIKSINNVRGSNYHYVNLTNKTKNKIKLEINNLNYEYINNMKLLI